MDLAVMIAGVDAQAARKMAAPPTAIIACRGWRIVCLEFIGIAPLGESPAGVDMHPAGLMVSHAYQGCFSPCVGSRFGSGFFC